MLTNELGMQPSIDLNYLSWPVTGSEFGMI
jgi:hypothetical protein